MVSFLLAIGLSIITVVADWIIKIASLEKGFLGWKMLTLGCLVYALTGVGWFFVMRNMKLSVSGVLYGVTCILLLALLSIFYFREKITTLELLGLGLAVASIVLLARFE